ncbi:hypothetical protein HG263_01460 [Pseudoalteromonas sp. JBTF-M23]|uniref:Uncharacterized protein n=1 Tax=Pseudoalteromonas caenipelagi TaxID=2726988 RepID=A0A849V8W9_9GAMM|nr:hypothetical protein [Pseudoalteromonas caenipelagi]NOU49220.1 hypothetical protein [Pseudoalteromonas caenipelagi]
MFRLLMIYLLAIGFNADAQPKSEELSRLSTQLYSLIDSTSTAKQLSVLANVETLYAPTQGIHIAMILKIKTLSSVPQHVKNDVYQSTSMQELSKQLKAVSHQIFSLEKIHTSLVKNNEDTEGKTIADKLSFAKKMKVSLAQKYNNQSNRLIEHYMAKQLSSEIYENFLALACNIEQFNLTNSPTESFAFTLRTASALTEELATNSVWVFPNESITHCQQEHATQLLRESTIAMEI